MKIKVLVTPDGEGTSEYTLEKVGNSRQYLKFETKGSILATVYILKDSDA